MYAEHRIYMKGKRHCMVHSYIHFSLYSTSRQIYFDFNRETQREKGITTDVDQIQRPSRVVRRENECTDALRYIKWVYRRQHQNAIAKDQSVGINSHKECC